MFIILKMNNVKFVGGLFMAAGLSQQGFAYWDNYYNEANNYECHYDWNYG